VLLLAPAVPGRALLIFYFLMFAPVCFAFLPIRERADWLALGVLLMLLLPATVYNAREVYLGYQANHQANITNHYKLSVAGYEIRLGKIIEEPLTLYRLPNEYYAETMPYQRPLIEKWIKKFYRLPPD